MTTAVTIHQSRNEFKLKFIDIENWPRRDIFHFYGRMDYPQYNICADLDMSRIMPYLKIHRLSVFKTVLYVVCRAANAMAELRHRIRGEQVIEHDTVHPSFTVLTDDKRFGFCAVEYTEKMGVFFERVGEGITAAKTHPVLTDEPGRDDYLFVSSLPWIRFTSISHPIHMHPADSVPRISWGKHVTENGKICMPLSIQVHHALVDGYHVGQFFNRVQELFDRPEKLLAGLQKQPS